MIYDCFTYFNEDLILELRLNYLNEVVDKFVIIEANKTFSGKIKKQNFDINKFKDFADKIIYVFLEDLPETKNPWVIESVQRNYIHEVLKKEKVLNDDIIMVSDIDEIPAIKAILQYKENPQGIGFFTLRSFNYYLNLLNLSKQYWIKAKIFKYKEFYRPVENTSIDLINRCMPIDYNKTNTANRIRINSFETGLNYLGWHFSWLGGAEKIKLKLESFSHQEWNTEEFTNIKHIEDCLKNQKSVINDNCLYQKVEIDSTYPKYLIDNIDKFQDYIL